MMNIEIPKSANYVGVVLLDYIRIIKKKQFEISWLQNDEESQDEFAWVDN